MLHGLCILTLASTMVVIDSRSRLSFPIPQESLVAVNCVSNVRYSNLQEYLHYPGKFIFRLSNGNLRNESDLRSLILLHYIAQKYYQLSGYSSFYKPCPSIASAGYPRYVALCKRRETRIA